MSSYHQAVINMSTEPRREHPYSVTSFDAVESRALFSEAEETRLRSTGAAEGESKDHSLCPPFSQGDVGDT